MTKMKSCVFLLSAFLGVSGVLAGDYFRSMQGLARLFQTEKAVVRALRRHLEPCEATWRRAAAVVPLVRTKLRVAALTRKGSRPGEQYLLRLLRRSALDAMSGVFRDFRCPRPLIDNAGFLPWPTEEDVDGAAAGICRLQKAYHITPEHGVAAMRSPELVQPTADDMLSLAVHCSLRERTLADEWAALGAADMRFAYFLERHLPTLETSTRTASFKAWRKVVGYPPETPAMWLYRDLVRGAVRSSFVSDSSFGKLCRTSREGDTRPASSLMCWLSRGKRGAASLAPFAVEALSAAEPRVWLIHNFLSATECAALRRLPETLAPAEVVNTDGGTVVQDVRTAEMAWLKDNANTSVLYRRTEVLTGLSLESAEELQVLNYGIGGHYDAHIDPLDAWVTEAYGERLATLLVYLSDVAEGGATAFTEAGLSIAPRLGSALFWFNLKENSAGLWERDRSTMHGSCPVLRGSKWIATLWIHERVQPADFNYTLP
ncbi:prolyl 4-hydroxylase subunit alpha-3-like [Amblyomma americanum]